MPRVLRCALRINCSAAAVRLASCAISLDDSFPRARQLRRPRRRASARAARASGHSPREFMGRHRTTTLMFPESAMVLYALAQRQQLVEKSALWRRGKVCARRGCWSSRYGTRGEE